MIGKKQLRKPDRWQDFESLCKKLWGEIWGCQNTIKKNGRNGQVQNGVDVYAIPKGECDYFGIQCKGKDEYTNSDLSESEIDTEIQKALKFNPPLKQFIFATTANKDTKIEEYVRQKDIQSRKNGKFEIHLFCWEDIVDLIDENRGTYNWYVNSCQYSEKCDVEVSFEGNKEINIYPEYIRTITKYKYKELSEREIELQKLYNSINLNHVEIPDISMFSNLFNSPPAKEDYRWCEIRFNLKNIGNKVIQNYQLVLLFDGDKVDKVDDLFRTFNPFPPGLYDQNMVYQINRDRLAEREVFKSSQYRNVLEFKPVKNEKLIQNAEKYFSVSIKPKDNITEIDLYWELQGEDFNKTGSLKIKVIPKFIDLQKEKVVFSRSEVLEDEIEITPRIE